MIATTPYQKIELAHIATLDDLDAEILKRKARTTIQQELLKEKLKQLPKELLKAGALYVVPGFLAARLTKRTYGAASGLLGWLFRRRHDDKHEAKKGMVKSFKQMGIYTGLTFLFKLLKDKF